VLQAACRKYKMQKSRQKSPSGHHRATLSVHIFATGTYRQSEKRVKEVHHNMVNFGPLAAEIGLPVWGTPANFNGFRVLAALLHGSQVVGVSQTAALNRGRRLCSEGAMTLGTGSHSSFLLR